MNLTEFINTHNGKTVDVDGAYGGQCWDLWSKYAQEVYGLNQADTNTGDGYAASVYTTKYSQSKALQNTFEKKPANYTPVAGDVAFWKRSGMNHVAIVINTGNSTLTVFSQNPNKPQVMTISKNGLIGYFHPRTLTTTTTNNTVTGGNVTIIARTYKVNVSKLNVRDRPSLSGTIVATYRQGETVNLQAGGTIADGYIWARYVGGSGKTRYIALAPTDKSTWYLVYA